MYDYYEMNCMLLDHGFTPKYVEPCIYRLASGKDVSLYYGETCSHFNFFIARSATCIYPERRMINCISKFKSTPFPPDFFGTLQNIHDDIKCGMPYDTVLHNIRQREILENL